MEIVNPILTFIWRRIISLIFLVLYIVSWIYTFIFFHTLPVSTKLRCGMPDFGMIVGILSLTFIYFVTFLIITLVSKGRSKNEFMVISAIIPLPVYIGIIDILTWILLIGTTNHDQQTKPSRRSHSYRMKYSGTEILRLRYHLQTLNKNRPLDWNAVEWRDLSRG